MKYSLFLGVPRAFGHTLEPGAAWASGLEAWRHIDSGENSLEARE